MRSPRVAFVAVAAALVATATIWHFAAAPDPAGAPPTTALDEDSGDEPAFELDGSARELAALRREPGACAVVFPSGEAHLSDESIALAALDTFDVGSKRTRTESARGDADGAFTVTSCRGTRVQAWARADLERGSVNVVSSLVMGAPEIAEDAGLGSSVVARLIIGEVPASAPCARAKGFMVLASLRERRLEIDALAEWEGTCGSIEPVSIIRLGREVALLEEDSDTEGDGPQTEWSRVWLRRGAALVHVGNVQTKLEHESEERSMTAVLVPSPRGVVARETWTHEPADGAPSKTKVIERAYVLEGLKLE